MERKIFRINVFGLFKLETEGWEPSDILLALLEVMIFVLTVLILIIFTRYR